MKLIKVAGRALGVVALAAAATACSSDNEPVKEPETSEVINEVTLTLMRRQDSVVQSAVIVDPDGPGPLPWQVQSGTLALAPNSTYSATITLTNSTTSPAVDVTPLINSRKLQHRFFYTVCRGMVSRQPTSQSTATVLTTARRLPFTSRPWSSPATGRCRCC